jgi:hypothetical protein
MRDNFFEWEDHYRDILTYHFEKFNIFLAENGEDATDYETFTRFIYINTIKRKHPYLNKLIAPLW